MFMSGAKVVYFSGDIQKVADDARIARPTILLSMHAQNWGLFVCLSHPITNFPNRIDLNSGATVAEQDL